MGRASCCEKRGLKKGPWTPKEDKILADYIKKNGDGSWRGLPKLAGLLRCGKSCRLRWTNHLKPGIKRGSFTIEEEQILISLHAILGNRWSVIASQIPGRTYNGIKNFWNTHLKKRLEYPCIADMTMDPTEYRAFEDFYSSEETNLAHMYYTGCSELLLEFPHNNNSSIDCMITELSPSFQQQLPWQWPEIHLEDNKDDMINMSIIAHS